MSGISCYEGTDGKRSWRVDFRIKVPDGRTRRIIRKGLATKKQAEMLIVKAKADAFSGRYFDRPPARRMTVDEAWTRFAPISRRDKRSWQTDAGRAAHIVRHLGSIVAADLTLRQIDRYRALRATETTKRGAAPTTATVNREVALLRHALAYAVTCGDLERNPLDGLRLVAEHNVREVVLDERDFDRLHAVAEQTLRPIIVVGFETGLRKAEILRLRWESVDMREGRLCLGAADTKTRKARVVYMTARVRAVFESIPRSVSGFVFVNPKTGRPWDDIRKAFRRACEAAGLPGTWFHDLRRSFVTRAVRHGLPETTVMRLSGHRDPGVFRRYNIVEDQDLRLAAERLDEARIVEECEPSETESGKKAERPLALGA